MKAVEIYTSPLCGFCSAAKRLLTQKGVTFSEIDVWSSPDRKPEMIQSVPMAAAPYRRYSWAIFMSAAAMTFTRWNGPESWTRCCAPDCDACGPSSTQQLVTIRFRTCR